MVTAISPSAMHALVALSEKYSPSERMTAKRRVCYQPIHFLCLNIAYEAFTEKETRLYGEYHFFFKTQKSKIS
jgi:hypothetical protein